MYYFLHLQLDMKQIEIIEDIEKDLENTNFFVAFPEIGRVISQITITEVYISKVDKKQFTFIISFNEDQIKDIREEFKNFKLKQYLKKMKVEQRKLLRLIKDFVMKKMPNIQDITKEFVLQKVQKEISLM